MLKAIMNDNYSHDDYGLFYIAENIIGPVEKSVEYEQLLNNFNSQLAHSCNCENICSPETCCCLQMSGGNNYIPYYKGEILKYKLNNKRGLYPIVECNNNCACTNICGNRVVQTGPIEGLKIQTCNEISKGLGLYSKSFISKGTFVCEYSGELITKSQASKRHAANELNRKMNYILCLNEHSGGRVMQTFVDPSTFGNIGRYINHSCEPNCEILPVRCQSPIPKLAIFSCQNILSDEEITFNYSSNHKTVSSGIKCLCNKSQCIGFMPYDKYF